MRRPNDLERKPVEQVRAKSSFLDQPGKMLVRRGHDPDVDLDRL
jgi:hypothetical protein